MDNVELQIAPLLQELFLMTETHCVRECCGIDAFNPESENIRAWAHEMGRPAATKALEELITLINVTESSELGVGSMFLNAATPDEPARKLLLDFLACYARQLESFLNQEV